MKISNENLILSWRKSDSERDLCQETAGENEDDVFG